MTRTVIRGGQVASSREVRRADVSYAGGRVEQVAEHIEPQPGDRVIDAEGLLVLPGIVDAHTHIQLDTGIYKTADDWLTGTRTAAAGGVTTVIDFATQYPGQTFEEAINNRHAEAADAVVDYALHCMITEFPIGREEELKTLIEMGVPSFKVYTTYRPNYYMDDATLLRLLQATARIGGLVIVHAENDDIVTEATQALVDAVQTEWRFHALGRPAIAEQEAVHRVLFLAGAADAPVYIVHCTTARSVEMVREAAQRGQRAWCETCPQYLLLDETVYKSDHPQHYILQPPIRAEGEPEKLWRLVSQGAVDVISTDSCDYTIQQKVEYEEFVNTPGGLPGIETLLPLMYTYGVEGGHIALTDLVRLMAERPAQIFGLAPRKGFLEPGSDADIVLYDPRPAKAIRHEDLHYLAGYSPYEGFRVQGEVHTTISRGEIVYQNGEICGKPGRGKFVPGKALPVEKPEEA